MLINDFFTISELTNSEDTIESKVQLNASHKIFDGHFPGNPVTPGVVQIQIVKELLEKALEKEYVLKLSIRFLKEKLFLGMQIGEKAYVL